MLNNSHEWTTSADRSLLEINSFVFDSKKSERYANFRAQCPSLVLCRFCLKFLVSFLSQRALIRKHQWFCLRNGKCSDTPLSRYNAHFLLLTKLVVLERFKHVSYTLCRYVQFKRPPWHKFIVYELHQPKSHYMVHLALSRWKLRSS